MKILITGATGLVGTALLQLCQSRNIKVNYLTTDKEKLNSYNGHQGFYWNPETGQIDQDCFTDVSAIINLAGASITKRWTRANKEVILESRINSLRTLYKGLERIDNIQIKTIVSASAIGRYPNSLSNYYTEEEMEVDDSFLGHVVELWEKEIVKFRSLHIRVAKIRIGLVLSRSGGALPQMSKSIRYFLGSAFGSGNQWQSWIHIKDLARMFLFVIDHNLKGTFNGVAPNPVTNSKMVKEIADVFNRPLILPNVPKFVLKILLGEMSYLLFASQRVSSKKIEEVGFDFNYQNINSALHDILGRNETPENTDPLIDEEYN